MQIIGNTMSNPLENIDIRKNKNRVLNDVLGIVSNIFMSMYPRRQVLKRPWLSFGRLQETTLCRFNCDGCGGQRTGRQGYKNGDQLRLPDDHSRLRAQNRQNWQSGVTRLCVHLFVRAQWMLFSKSYYIFKFFIFQLVNTL